MALKPPSGSPRRAAITSCAQPRLPQRSCSARRTCPGRNSSRGTGIPQSSDRLGGPEVSHRGASHPAGPATRPASQTAGSHASHRKAPRPSGDPGVPGCFGVGSLRAAQPRAATPGEPWRAGPFGRSAPTRSTLSAIRLSPGYPRRPTAFIATIGPRSKPMARRRWPTPSQTCKWRLREANRSL